MGQKPNNEFPLSYFVTHGPHVAFLLFLFPRNVALQLHMVTIHEKSLQVVAHLMLRLLRF